MTNDFYFSKLHKIKVSLTMDLIKIKTFSATPTQTFKKKLFRFLQKTFAQTSSIQFYPNSFLILANLTTVFKLRYSSLCKTKKNWSMTKMIKTSFIVLGTLFSASFFWGLRRISSGNPLLIKSLSNTPSY